MKRGLAGGVVVLVLLALFLGLSPSPTGAAPVQTCTDYPPTGCTTTSTTTPGQVTSTTSPGQVTSTTSARQVTSTTRAQVLGNTDTKPTSGKLARTGSDLFGLVQLALLVIGLGAWTLYVRRRRVDRFATK